RAAMVMSPDRDGIFDTLLRLVRVGLGGAVGGGRQYVSWIHYEDFVRAVSWLIDHDEMDGAVNVAAPHPLPYRDFMAALRIVAYIGRIARDEMDVRDRHVHVAHRVGTGAEEPPRRPGQTFERRIRFPMSRMAGGRARVVRRMAERSLMRVLQA